MLAETIFTKCIGCGWRQNSREAMGDVTFKEYYCIKCGDLLLIRTEYEKYKEPEKKRKRTKAEIRKAKCREIYVRANQIHTALVESKTEGEVSLKFLGGGQNMAFYSSKLDGQLNVGEIYKVLIAMNSYRDKNDPAEPVGIVIKVLEELGKQEHWNAMLQCASSESEGY